MQLLRVLSTAASNDGSAGSISLKFCDGVLGGSDSMPPESRRTNGLTNEKGLLRALQRRAILDGFLVLWSSGFASFVDSPPLAFGQNSTHNGPLGHTPISVRGSGSLGSSFHDGHPLRRPSKLRISLRGDPKRAHHAASRRHNRHTMIVLGVRLSYQHLIASQ